jgi:hypothetical protein
MLIFCLGKYDDIVEIYRFVVSDGGIKTDPDKVSVVKNWPAIKNVKDLRKVLGFTSDTIHSRYLISVLKISHFLLFSFRFCSFSLLKTDSNLLICSSSVLKNMMMSSRYIRHSTVYRVPDSLLNWISVQSIGSAQLKSRTNRNQHSLFTKVKKLFVYIWFDNMYPEKCRKTRILHILELRENK